MNSPQQQLEPRSGGWVVRIVTFAIAVTIGLAASEILVRIFAPQPLQSPISDTVDGLDVLRPNLHARARVPHEFDVRMTINSQRFRANKEYALQPGSALRIATLGDSFTFGAGVNDDEPYPRVLENLVGASGLSAEVINAGIPGLGTGEEALFYRDWVRQFHPRIVILTVTSSDPSDDTERQIFTIQPDGTAIPRPTNQLAGSSRSFDSIRRLTYSAPFRFLGENSSLYSLVRQTVSDRMRSSRREALTAASMASSSADALRTTRGEIEWLNRQVVADGGKLVVAYFPSVLLAQPDRYPHEYDDDREGEKRLASALATNCADLKIPFVDATPSMRAAADELGPQHPLFYRGIDEHPNALGYRTFATAVSRFLQDNVLRNPAP